MPDYDIIAKCESCCNVHPYSKVNFVYELNLGKVDHGVFYRLQCVNCKKWNQVIMEISKEVF